MRIDSFQVRRGTAADWTAINPILKDGEEGYETDTRLSKHGDGNTAWNDLPYDAGGGSSSGSIDGGAPGDTIFPAIDGGTP